MNYEGGWKDDKREGYGVYSSIFSDINRPNRSYLVDFSVATDCNQPLMDNLWGTRCPRVVNFTGVDWYI